MYKWKIHAKGIPLIKSLITYGKRKKNGTQKIDPEKLERKRAAEDQKSTLLKNNPLLYCPIHLLKKQKNPYCSQM